MVGRRVPPKPSSEPGLGQSGAAPYDYTVRGVTWRRIAGKGGKMKAAPPHSGRRLRVPESLLLGHPSKGSRADTDPPRERTRSGQMARQPARCAAAIDLTPCGAVGQAVSPGRRGRPATAWAPPNRRRDRQGEALDRRSNQGKLDNRLVGLKLRVIASDCLRSVHARLDRRTPFPGAQAVVAQRAPRWSQTRGRDVSQ